MAASVLDGEKICEVSGKVNWSSVQRVGGSFESGSIALYKLSTSFYVHAIEKAKRTKFLLKPDKFNVFTRESQLTLSVQGGTKHSGTVSINLKEAVPNQLRLFLDSLNEVKACNAFFRGKLLSRENDIQDIENQPCNGVNSNVSSARVRNFESPLRSNLVPSSSSHSTPKVTPNRPTNYFAKQMKPASSLNSQNKKTPLHDQTRARDNLSNTSSSGRSSSASSFYGSSNSTWSTPSERRSTGKSLGPGLMPPPQSRSQTSYLASQITFRSREKRPFEKEVALTGFSNLGNTCYMNAILQSLLGVPPFVQDLSNKALLEKTHPQCLYRCLHSVMSCKRKRENSDMLRNHLRKLKRTISEAATRFSGYHQHDAHEFLCQVFDQLRDDVSTCISPASKTTSKDSNDMVADSQCPVTRSFESGVLHTISCKQCGESAPKEEIYHVFSLDIPTLCNSSGSSPIIGANMKTLIEKHFEDEELEYTCSKCESKEAVISHSFSRLPRVLILHLKRYGYDNLTEEQAKKQDKVNIERFIDLKMLCSPNTKVPLVFQPKPLVKLSPPKSRQKPQKRHFICEDDDDGDTSDFQPSPSVRRKLDHSFSNTVTSSTAKGSSANAKTKSEDDMEATGDCKFDLTDECNSGAVSSDEKHFTKGHAGKQQSFLDAHFLRSEKPVSERTEEEQMEWALAESAKSAKKESRAKLRVQNIDQVEKKCRRTSESPFKGSPPNTKINSDDDREICNSYGGIKTSEEEYMEGSMDVNWLGGGKPFSEQTEEEQLKWALAESAKSAEKESRAKSRTPKVQSRTEQSETCESQTPTADVDFHDADFVLLSDVSDEDLVNAAQENDTSEPRGLKGGAPIVTQGCPDNVDVIDKNNVHLENDEINSPQNCSEDSGLEKNAGKAFVVKNSPILIVKRKNGSFHRKPKTFDSSVLDKTPTLGKFDGDLFGDVPKENKVSSTSVSASGTESGWFRSSTLAKFRDEDMEKAINMSLQDQQMFSEEDEELKRALQLSLQEFEGKCPAEDQPASPANMDLADTENSTDSALQDESSEVSSQSHSYRLISVVNHLGSRSTSGHYISDVYDCKTKQWTSYDDSTATKVTEHTVRYKRQESGYIFFYLYKQCVDAIENSSPSKENSLR